MLPYFAMSSIPYVPLLLLLLLATLFQGSWSSCVRNGVDYQGADSWNLLAYSLDQCTNVCKAIRYCKSVTYRSSDKRCWLKFRRGGNSGPTLVGGLQSVNMDCDNKRDQSCAKHNVDYAGADLGGRRAVSLDQCEQFCRDTDRCKSITYSTGSDRTCYLKHRASGARGPTSKAGLISLNMECPTSDLINSK